MAHAAASRVALRAVPSRILRPSYADTGIVDPSPTNIILYRDPEDIEAIRHAARLARRVLDLAISLASPGVSTLDIDAKVHDAICGEGAYPAPLNYKGFPRSVTSSINEEVCHGIPTGYILRQGDIAKFDVSVFTKEGFFGDNCGTVVVGEDGKGEGEESLASRLNRVTKFALDSSIRSLGPGVCLTQIGEIIETIAEREGFESVEAYCGHGVGRSFHMLPFVQHFRNTTRLTLTEGMVFTIEPMFTAGKQYTKVCDDQWTVVTLDGSLAAQYEHMVRITSNGVEVLTDSETAPEFSDLQ
ncbi:hypothetical protein AAMO2058_000066900 [Amorphochlora amoebiformis]